VSARRNDASPNHISFDKHSPCTDHSGCVRGILSIEARRPTELNLIPDLHQNLPCDGSPWQSPSLACSACRFLAQAQKSAWFARCRMSLINWIFARES
jgi:hypothetical protein